MRKMLSLLLVCIFLGTACAPPATVETLRVLTEEYPPYNYTDAAGKLVGQSTEKVQAIMAKVSPGTNIEVLPWAQAYQILQTEPSVALYSMARTAEREHLFMWVGPIGSYENWLYAKKGSGIQVSSLDEARAVKSIAAVRDEAGQIKLANQGFINFTYADSTPDGLKKLMSGEADLWLGPRENVALVAEKAGVSADDLEPVVFVHKVDLFVAFNKNTPYATVQAWQQSLDSLTR